MTRWGQEEKKTQGLFGFAFALMVTGLFCYAAYRNYYSLEGRRLLEKNMQEIVRAGGGKSEQEMKSEIYAVASELGLNLSAEDVSLKKKLDANGNWVVDCRIELTAEVDYLLGTYAIDLPIREKVTIVLF